MRFSLRNFSILILLTTLVVLGAGACTRPRSGNELVVGMDLSYPPFETIDPSGKPSGISVDIANALGESLGRPVRIENIPFTGLVPSLKTGKIDCVISSMTDTPERRGSIAFSDPYLTVGLALLVAKNSDILSITDLDQTGKTLAVRDDRRGLGPCKYQECQNPRFGKRGFGRPRGDPGESRRVPLRPDERLEECAGTACCHQSPPHTGSN